MPDRVVKMGFEGQLYYGEAGSTASTLLENVKDISIDNTIKTGDTTVRGDGSIAPVETQSVTSRMAQIKFTMILDTTDVGLQALLTALANGTGIALRGKRYSDGTGPDADFILSATNGQPLQGEQTFEFTAMPSRDYGRAPQTDV